MEADKKTTEPAAGAGKPIVIGRKRAMTAAVIAGCIAIGGALLYHRKAPDEDTGLPGFTATADGVVMTKDAPQWKSIRVGVASESTNRFSDPLPAEVAVDPTLSAQIGAPLPGRVTAVFTELGAQVKSGEALFAVASTDIAGLRADLDRAALEAAGAQSNYDRIKAMVDARALPAKDLIQSERELREAQLNERLARSKLESLRVATRGDGNEYVVRAPRAGVVVAKNVLPSQEVAPGGSDPLITVSDLSRVWVKADAFENLASVLKSGTVAKVTFPSRPGVEMSAKVDSVSAVVDPERRTVGIRLTLPNADGALKPNMYAEVRFELSAYPGSMEIPASALVSDGERQYVYIEESPGNFRKRAVNAGPVHDGRVPVFEGVKSGERVVEEGAILLDNQISLSNL